MISPASQGSANGQHFVQLDGLRAIAVTLVMLWHFLPVEDPFRETFRWGWFGVRMFFVLSGFLITYILLRERDRCQAGGVSQIIRAFYARRALRIFPLYFCYVFLLLATTDEMGKYILWFVFYLQNVLFFSEGSLDLVPGAALLWTLAFEEQFYLVWPTILLFTPRTLLPLLLPVLIALGVVTRLLLILLFEDIAVGTAMVFPTSNMDSMVLGATLAYLRHYTILGERLDSLLRRVGLVGALFVLIQMISWSVFEIRLGNSPVERFAFVVSDFFAGLFFVWLIDAAVNQSLRGFGSVLEHPFLVWVGKISYGVYVLHLFVAKALLIVISKLTGLDPGDRSYLLLLPSIAASIAVASLSWTFFESPLNSLKSRFPYCKRTKTLVKNVTSS